MCHVPFPIWWFVGYLFLSKQSETLNTLDMHISLQSFVGRITFYREINKSLNLLSWKKYECCHSAASCLQLVKNTGKQHQVQYKRTGVYHCSSSLDSIFSCHFLRSNYIYTQFLFFPGFSAEVHIHMGPAWATLTHCESFQCMVPGHQVWHSAAQMSEERSHSLAPSTPQPQSWGKMFTWDFWCLKSKVMTWNCKPPARECSWFIVFMMSGKIPF